MLSDLHARQPGGADLRSGCADAGKDVAIRQLQLVIPEVEVLQGGCLDGRVHVPHALEDAAGHRIALQVRQQVHLEGVGLRAAPQPPVNP